MNQGDLPAILRQHGQEHLLAFWGQLEAAGRESLARQIEGIDFPLIGKLFAERQNQGNFRDLALRNGAGCLPTGRNEEPVLAGRGPSPGLSGARRRRGGRDPGCRRAGNAAGVRPPQGHVFDRPCLRPNLVSNPHRKNPGDSPAAWGSDTALPDDESGNARRDAPVPRRA